MVRRSYSTILAACLVGLAIVKVAGCATGGSAANDDLSDDELTPFVPGIGNGVGTDRGAGGFGGGGPGPGGAGGFGNTCAHDVCVPGAALERFCDSCVENVCADDAFCCTSEWDASCINQMADFCPDRCGSGAGGAGGAPATTASSSSDASSSAVTSTSSGGGACAHDLCAEGVALDPTCDPCAQTVCDQDDYCCTSEWDATCVGEVDRFCGPTCGTGATTSSATTSSGAGGGVVCAHDTCVEGEALDPDCDPCAAAVCAEDDYCCTTEWDGTCVLEVDLYCATSC